MYGAKVIHQYVCWWPGNNGFYVISSPSADFKFRDVELQDFYLLKISFNLSGPDDIQNHQQNSWNLEASWQIKNTQAWH